MARRPSSVRPSVCKLLRKSLLLPGKWPDRDQTCTRWSPGKHAFRVCSRSRSRSKVTWYVHFLGFLEWATPSLTVWLYHLSLQIITDFNIKELLKSVYLCQNYPKIKVARFYGPRCIFGAWMSMSWAVVVISASTSGKHNYALIPNCTPHVPTASTSCCIRHLTPSFRRCNLSAVSPTERRYSVTLDPKRKWWHHLIHRFHVSVELCGHCSSVVTTE